MTTEELIRKMIDKCFKNANGDQRWLFMWMRATQKLPGLNQFVVEMKSMQLYIIYNNNQ